MSAATCSRGIINPAKVVCIALQDAASIAGLMITTEAWAWKHRKRKPANPTITMAAWAA